MVKVLIFFTFSKLLLRKDFDTHRPLGTCYIDQEPMTPVERLKSILNDGHEFKNGELYKVELLEGMTDQEVENFRNRLPEQRLPKDIEDLLSFTRGLKLGSEEVRFDTFGHFKLDELLPYPIQLARDGYGNFWILNIDSKGNWNSVYYVSHDPEVIIKHSENLTDFIEHVAELGKKDRMSNLGIIYEKIVMKIWQEKSAMELNGKNGLGQIIPSADCPGEDMKHSPTTIGFWVKAGTKRKNNGRSAEQILSVGDKVKESLLSRLFGGGNK